MGVAGFQQADIEKAALSCMMQWETCSAEGAEKLTEGHFSLPPCRTIFVELVVIWSAGTPFDLILFTKHLADKHLLNRIGGPAEITTIYTFAHSPRVMRYYIGLLDEEFQRREFVSTAKEAIRDVESNQEAIPDALSKLSEIPLRRSDTPTFVEAVSDKINRMEHGEADSDIIKTGIEKLDLHSPLRNGDMPLIAGERKAGKSVLSITIAVNVARDGTPVLYISLEDRIPKVMDRIFAGVARVPMHLHHIGRLGEADLARCVAASKTLGNLPLTIRDDAYDLHVIIAIIRQAKARQQTGLVVVDYAQLIRAKAENRRSEVEKVSRELRLCAMELNLPIILLCQLNKDNETRETKALEMDATAMWRIEVIDDETPGERRIVIPFQRNGESGNVFKVAFLGAIARVENLSAARSNA